MTTQMTAQQRRDHNNGEKFRAVSYACALLLAIGASRIILTASVGLEISAGALVGIGAAALLLPVLLLAAAQDMPRWFNPVVVVLLATSVITQALWGYAVLTNNAII